MQVASQEGQTIYHITKDNYSQILPQLKLSSHVMSDIRDAISAGREVTAHEKNIRVNGWSDSGYVILDPKYGTGAYLIDGGANGGYAFFMGSLLGYAILMGLYAIEGRAFTAAAMAEALPLLLAVLIPTIVMFTAFIAFMVATDDENYTNSLCFLSGMGTGLSVAGGVIGALAKSLFVGIIGGSIASAVSYGSSVGCFKGA